ncbi:DUF2931 family protein [uncultured Aquimarina sp.]|uniref:DUF2931 family protein n=1 Tax=uncultured Aquimarina sp. TaxID=575652 RepID=UPI0026202965|nr:DUF2931 family protein [uncultured Aquimarina sp.]
MTRRYFSLIILMMIYLNSCKNSEKNNISETGSIMTTNQKDKKYEWLPTECAPEIYPIRIKEGYFITKDGTSIEIPSGGRTVHNGWGQIGSTYLVGDDLKPIPQKLKITWISYAENKFYKGDFDLPSEEIRQFFEKGFLDRRNKQENYSKIVVGMAPGGIVSIWLLGAGSTVEIGQYIAQEIDMEIKDLSPNTTLDRATYVSNRVNSLKEDKLKKLNEVGIRTDIWKTYRERFSWKPVYTFKSEAEATKTLIDFFNGESIHTFSKNPLLTSFQDFAIPKYTRFYWVDKNKNEFGTKIYFDELEIFEAFDKIFANPKTKQAIINFDVDKYNSNIVVYIESEIERVELKKLTIKIYEASK